ncbi:MAG: cytochrome c peroxidase [Saprospiraceae bacterium]|nr:cytochrome c peroxidase [Saprospiraceae bacterium]
MEDPRFDGVVYAPTPYLLSYPDRFPQPEIPADNPLTEEGVQLGRRLFYDPLLHASGEQACAGCHQQSLAFTSDGPVLPHINLGWNSAFLWDGKVQGTLEDIMLFEVKEFFAADMDRFNAHATYPVLFYEAFGEKVVTHEMAAMALAQFQRTMISGNSRYDRFMNGEIFLTDDEYDGLEIFFTERGDCFHCHGGVLFTDNMFHNNALDADPEQGLARNTGLSQDIGKFKSPTLRNIALTAPYMHDGRYATLGDVINFYSEGLQNSETVDPLMKQLHRGGIQLTMREKEALIAFLHCLTDTSFIQNSALLSPF